MKNKEESMNKSVLIRNEKIRYYCTEKCRHLNNGDTDRKDILEMFQKRSTKKYVQSNKTIVSIQLMYRVFENTVRKLMVVILH